MTERRLTLQDAAQELGITPDALRQRIRRGQYHSTLISALEDRIESLERQLTEANERDRENRRIIAALTQRIPELEPTREASLESRESPEGVDETAERVNPPPPEEPREEARQRPWYRRWFGA
jgi:predicted ribosome quality control (RQC) complex YloA/Tae2 family protein